MVPAHIFSPELTVALPLCQEPMGWHCHPGRAAPRWLLLGDLSREGTVAWVKRQQIAKDSPSPVDRG